MLEPPETPMPPAPDGNPPTPVNIEDEMRSSFLDYSMSVIISRALPDVRDGLKPSQRRILVTFNDLNLSAGRPYRKCAKISGDVSGNYHPHGEAVIYPSIVRLAQPFSLRYPLIDGQGNFGSIDGDPPAAMRYTEARLSPIAAELLADIDRETVDFVPNYDNTRSEPVVLPARIPNLVVNGSTGIAVGMATNIPPHNLGEVVDALILLAREPQTDLGSLMEKLPGPDFPTGAIICGTAGIRQAYRTGRGLLTVRARADFEDGRAGRRRIVVSEIPYMVNKATMIEKIADLVRQGRIDGIADLRDESDRRGMRVVVELKKDVDEQVLLNNLYKLSPMQNTFGVNMVALVNNRPRTLGLVELLSHFLEFRREVVRRRAAFDLRQAEARSHILEGFARALDNLDAVIALIRSSQSPAEARRGLIERFELSEAQAQAILELRLQRLTAMERQKILDELAEIRARIAELRELLASDELVRDRIVEELEEVRERYTDARLSEIGPPVEDLTTEDLIADEDMVVTISHRGYAKRHPPASYRAQRRGGKGKQATTTREEDFVSKLFVASTHAFLLCFTSRGRGALGQGPPAPGAQPRRARTGAGQSAAAGGRRARVGDPAGTKLRRSRLRGPGHAQRPDQEDRAEPVRQPAPRRDHRAEPQGGRRADRGGPHLGRRRDPDRDPGGQGDPLPRRPGPTDGPYRRRGERHRRAPGRRSGGHGGAPAGPCDPRDHRKGLR